MDPTGIFETPETLCIRQTTTAKVKDEQRADGDNSLGANPQMVRQQFRNNLYEGWMLSRISEIITAGSYFTWKSFWQEDQLWR
ncbi:hypothetical protein O9929_26555 [Vibrio lentus]|nr:hypothetical protein [Vibrio lentus]